MVGKKAFTIIELLFVIGVFLIMIAVLGPFVHMAQVRADKIECANNLRKLSLALHTYAAEHDGRFPDTLDLLFPNYADGEGVFDCPAAKSAGTKEKPDYIYVKGLTELSPLKSIMAEDAPGNHGKKGRNVLRLSGAVDWVDERN